MGKDSATRRVSGSRYRPVTNWKRYHKNSPYEEGSGDLQLKIGIVLLALVLITLFVGWFAEVGTFRYRRYLGSVRRSKNKRRQD